MSATITSTPEASVPLCVDLDGTLIRTDILWESLLQLLKRNPLYLLALPFWLARGRANLKQQLAARVELDVAVLPYHQPFVEFLRAEHRQGRSLVLATAADHRLAQKVADHLGFFNSVVASNGEINLRGKNKVRQLAQRFGVRGFDYAGNSTVDLPVWQESRQAIVVNATERLAQQASQLTRVSGTFNEPNTALPALIKAIRPHQWVKNLIILVPLLTAHQLTNSRLLANALLAFVAFSLCASAVYVLNDLFDLEADRHHPTKRLRPFAAGRLSIPTGALLALACLAASTATAYLLSGEFLCVLALYFLLTSSYSWRFKQVELLDVFFLAGLYTMRLIAGHAATNIAYSFWLLAFSMFIFLSLALVKRFTELNALRQQNKQSSKGRGYLANDLELIATLGIVSGCLAVLVMALYVHSDEMLKLYHHPVVLLMVCPLLMYWISRVWLIAHRGKMHDDPIVFALKDRVSYLIGALTLAVLWLATGN
ncbi:MAG: putative Prenyltransferase, UbiA family [Pedosphaera sp.]|nr:putative Prenyltransferase, UbiA family [Pedosphaera sp.]